jgi:hypothetical protein|tara:strand:- start:9 stop:260 length:252 start_codon:yes stop_codon:yes gene_type:complete
MPVLTTIDGVPLYTTVQEALNYASDNGLTGYHTHTHNGQIGYMGGQTHGAASTASAGFVEEVPLSPGQDPNITPLSSPSGSGY